MRDTVTVVHNDSQGLPDYVFALTLEYDMEAGQWVGSCLELGTSAFSDTLEQVQEELHEAVELQLNELEGLTQVEDFLKANHVRLTLLAPAATPQKAGFAVVAGPQ